MVVLFKLKSDIIFESDDINGALLILSRHFINVALGVQSNLIIEGSINIDPVKNNKNISTDEMNMINSDNAKY